MIAIRNEPLSAKAMDELSRYQAEVDAETDFDKRVDLARSKFENRNRPDHTVFSEVRKTLASMCSGAQRCVYCEDSCADEVEHHHPVRWYPEKTFEWLNYLYACGSCNGPKGSGFSTDLLHPRVENPLDFLMLDLTGTFLFVPTNSAGTSEHQRASYTIQLLRLNVRSYLPVARREAYDSYRARLKEYIADRDKGAPITQRIQSLQRMAHPTVWHEMKRQHKLVPELKDLFTQAPEALHW
ncbi:MAG: hypothetical protein U0R19_16915 [Bryobacteraceae bacterium]